MSLELRAADLQKLAKIRIALSRKSLWEFCVTAFKFGSSSIF